MQKTHPKTRVLSVFNVCRSRHLGAIAALSIMAAAATVPARADFLPLPNASFELQQAPFVEPYVTTNVDNWTKNPQPSYFDPVAFGLAWDQTAGLFFNTPEGASNHIDNMDQIQAMYLLNFPGSGVSQDFNSTDWNHASPLHAFASTFEIGKAYSFTLGVIGGGGGMAEGSQLAISLYYLDGGGTPVPLNSTLITYTAAGFQGTNHFVDFEVSIPEVLATDAWAGQYVGVSIANVSGPAGGYWDVDNARVVPEPASAGLLAVGGLFLIRRRRA